MHSVLCHLQRTGRLLSFAAQDLPQREAKKLRIKVAVLNASLVGVSVVVPAGAFLSAPVWLGMLTLPSVS